LGAGGDKHPARDDQKSFDFMFTWQMQRQAVGEVAISPEPDAAGSLCRVRKMLVSNNFRKLPRRFIRVHLAIVKYEQLVAY